MQQYEDALCVQFMARMLQFKKDHKDDCTALILTEEEFVFKMMNDVCPINGVYNFIDGSSVVCYGNNEWVCSNYDKNEN